jgi:hypothetical protein
MTRFILPAIICLILAGAANGVMDTLQFHFTSQHVISRESLYWNPAKSWVLKYELNEEGKPLQPLRAAFPGSTTVFSFLTDGWHLMKFLYHGFLRLALILVSCAALFTWRIEVPWYGVVGAWIVLAGVQALGFHFTYTIIF